jgi:hypothetical protein
MFSWVRHSRIGSIVGSNGGDVYVSWGKVVEFTASAASAVDMAVGSFLGVFLAASIFKAKGFERD